MLLEGSFVRPGHLRQRRSFPRRACLVLSERPLEPIFVNHFLSTVTSATHLDQPWPIWLEKGTKRKRNQLFPARNQSYKVFIRSKDEKLISKSRFTTSGKIFVSCSESSPSAIGTGEQEKGAGEEEFTSQTDWKRKNIKLTKKNYH